MADYAKFRTPAVIMEPVAPDSVPVGSLYLDANNADVLSTKTTGGTEQPVGDVALNVMIKRKKNMSGSVIPAKKKVALKNDGSIVLADNDGIDTSMGIGFSMGPIDHGAYGNILLVGANVADAVVGMGFTPGDRIMLGNTPGALTNDLGSFNPSTDTIYRVGIADCAGETMNPTATDLIMMAEILSTPPTPP